MAAKIQHFKKDHIKILSDVKLKSNQNSQKELFQLVLFSTVEKNTLYLQFKEQDVYFGSQFHTVQCPII